MDSAIYKVGGAVAVGAVVEAVDGAVGCVVVDLAVIDVVVTRYDLIQTHYPHHGVSIAIVKHL